MYFDPGTGSLIIQMILACIAGITSFFIVFKTNVKAFFSNRKAKKELKKEAKKEVNKNEKEDK